MQLQMLWKKTQTPLLDTHEAHFLLQNAERVIGKLRSVAV
jgi:hypothetical protein